MEKHIETAQRVISEVNKVILGKEQEVREVLLAFLANGHVLIEDIPGVGKTSLAVAFSRALGLDCKRVQFTPDVMPSDLTGFSIYRKEEERFVYQKGSIFCNLMLADEINRTSPKTQSALLEAMEERKVSVEGVTRELPDPFLVIATQNPFGGAGTHYLPEAQVDRFMVTLAMGYPDFESELKMAQEVREYERMDSIQQITSPEEFRQMQSKLHSVFIKDEVYHYILELVTATREHSGIERGASPRATIALVRMARAEAWIDGRDYCTPNDVAKQFPYVASHRIVPMLSSGKSYEDRLQLLTEIIETVKKPPMESMPLSSASGKLR